MQAVERFYTAVAVGAAVDLNTPAVVNQKQMDGEELRAHLSGFVGATILWQTQSSDENALFSISGQVKLNQKTQQFFDSFLVENGKISQFISTIQPIQPEKPKAPEPEPITISIAQRPPREENKSKEKVVKERPAGSQQRQQREEPRNRDDSSKPIKSSFSGVRK